MGVDLHIEELVLHGFAARDRNRIAREVERELTRLISERKLPGLGENRAFERIDGGVFQVRAGARPEATGTQIAHAIYRGLQQQTRASNRAQGTRRTTGAPRS